MEVDVYMNRKKGQAAQQRRSECKISKIKCQKATCAEEERKEYCNRTAGIHHIYTARLFLQSTDHQASVLVICRT